MARKPNGLTIPRIRVVMAGDGDQHEEWIVQALNPDLTKFERTAAKHRWPGVKDAPFLWLTFLGWSASQREGRINGMTFEAFEAAVLEVGDADTDDGEPATADPTPPGLGPG